MRIGTQNLDRPGLFQSGRRQDFHHRTDISTVLFERFCYDVKVDINESAMA